MGNGVAFLVGIWLVLWALLKFAPGFAFAFCSRLGLRSRFVCVCVLFALGFAFACCLRLRAVCVCVLFALGFALGMVASAFWLRLRLRLRLRLGFSLRFAFAFVVVL